MSDWQTRRFTCKLDGTARVVTALVLVALAGVPVAIVLGVTHGRGHVTVGALALGVVVPAAALAWAARARPRAYLVSPRTLVIENGHGNVEIPLAEITRVAPVERRELGVLVRTFGSGGFLGYFGRFWSSRLGALRLHATRRDRWVLVETRVHGSHVVSPDDRDGFIAAVEKQRSHAGS